MSGKSERSEPSRAFTFERLHQETPGLSGPERVVARAARHRPHPGFLGPAPRPRGSGRRGTESPRTALFGSHGPASEGVQVRFFYECYRFFCTEFVGPEDDGNTVVSIAGFSGFRDYITVGGLKREEFRVLVNVAHSGS